MQLMLQTCPEVHGNGANLNLYRSNFFAVGHVDRYIQNHVKTPVTIRFWIFDIVLDFSQLKSTVVCQEVCNCINVINIAADYPNSCNIC